MCCAPVAFCLFQLSWLSHSTCRNTLSYPSPGPEAQAALKAVMEAMDMEDQGQEEQEPPEVWAQVDDFSITNASC